MISSTVDRSGPVAITGLPQTVPVGFPFQQGSDLLVLDIGSVGTPRDPATTLTLGSDYTVTGGGYDAANNMLTGSITIVTGGTGAVIVNDRIVIMRAVPINQGQSFLATGPLTIALLEQALDKMATLAQQVNEICGRSLQFENFETLSPILSRASRLNKFLSFDANGNIAFSAGTSIGGNGTVTQVNSGTGLTGGPITTVGTLSFDFTGSYPWTGANSFTAGSAFIPVSIVGFANKQTLLVTASSTVGQSFGLQIFAGTNSGDYALYVGNAGASLMLKLNGLGQLILPLFYSAIGVMQTDASGNVTTGPLHGVTTNSNAAAGDVGEAVDVATGTPAALTTGVSANVIAVSLTAGDWDVSGTGVTAFGGATSVSDLNLSLSTTTATIDGNVGRLNEQKPGSAEVMSATATRSYQVGPCRFSLAVTTTVYLVANLTFTVSTAGMAGGIHARRVR